MPNNTDGLNGRSTCLLWDDERQAKLSLTPSTSSPASIHDFGSPHFSKSQIDPILTSSCYRRSKRKLQSDGNSILSDELNCKLNTNDKNDTNIWLPKFRCKKNNKNINKDNIEYQNSDINKSTNSADEIYKNGNNEENKVFETKDNICIEPNEVCINLQSSLQNNDNDIILQPQNSIKNLTDIIQVSSKPLVTNNNISKQIYQLHTVSKDSKSEENLIINNSSTNILLKGNIKPISDLDVTRFMDNDYLELLKTNLMLEFTKSRTCYLKLVPSVIEIFRIVRDAPSRCPIPVVQSIDDLGKEQNISKFESYFTNCISKQNSGFLAFCTERRALKSGGGGKYYFFDKKLQLNGCHKVDVLNHYKQKNISGPVFMKVLLFMFVVDPPYHLDPRARSSNPQRLMDFYYQLKSMNRLCALKRLLKVWCMEMCPEEYLDAGYPPGSLLWVSTLDIESHIKKWRYRGRKSQPTTSIRTINQKNMRLLPKIASNIEKLKQQTNSQQDIHQGKNSWSNKDDNHKNISTEKLDPTNSDTDINDSPPCTPTVKVYGSNYEAKVDLSNQQDGTLNNRKISITNQYKKNVLNNAHQCTNSIPLNSVNCPQISHYEEINTSTEREIQTPNITSSYDNVIWTLIRNIPVNCLNKLYQSWISGEIPGLSKLKSHCSLRFSNILSNSESQISENIPSSSYINNGEQDATDIIAPILYLDHRLVFSSIQHHLLVNPNELPIWIKLLESYSNNLQENLEFEHKSLDVMLNSYSCSFSMSFSCSSPIRSGNSENSQGSIERSQLSGDINETSPIFSLVSTNQYQSFVEIPDIATSLSEHILDDTSATLKSCNDINEPIDLYFAY
ncbi:hypothetical protein cand_005620 [Cryptosporidium andersoni]|uniref:Uncharacterized protein n=1 Tax=Cryptosporidium andersoni TaxID=117008 RepID=A0A1J4MT11_9CRYT|nr:hypothetical protein cand_005620 [Cryptosporidium andersoni]